MPRTNNGTRQKLIDTATNLIWTSSYGSVSVDDICKNATVKKGSFYHYFPSKESLAITVMTDYFKNTIEPDLKNIFAVNQPLDIQATTLCDFILKEQHAVLNKYGRVCGCPFAALASEMIGQEGQAIHDHAQKLFTIACGYLENALLVAIDTNQIEQCNASEKAREVHDFITGHLMMARVHNNLHGLEHDFKSGLFHILGLSKFVNDTKERHSS